MIKNLSGAVLTELNADRNGELSHINFIEESNAYTKEKLYAETVDPR